MMSEGMVDEGVMGEGMVDEGIMGEGVMAWWMRV